MRKLTILLAALVLFPRISAGEERAKATTKEAEMLVHKAIEYLQKEGREKALAAFNDPKGPFTYLDLYILVMATDGTVLAHGRNQKFVGQNDVDKKDAAGNYHFARRIVAIGNGPGKGWLEYEIENPQSHKVENKVAYVERTGDMIVSCGVFKPGGK